MINGEIEIMGTDDRTPLEKAIGRIATLEAQVALLMGMAGLGLPKSERELPDYCESCNTRIEEGEKKCPVCRGGR